MNDFDPRKVDSTEWNCIIAFDDLPEQEFWMWESRSNFGNNGDRFKVCFGSGSQGFLANDSTEELRYVVFDIVGNWEAAPFLELVNYYKKLKSNLS